MHLSKLADRRVAVWGLGREGMAAYRRFRSRFPTAPLVLLDDKPLSDAAKAMLVDDLNVELVIGEGVDAAIAGDRFDIVIKSPGISRYRPSAVAARERRCRFTSVTDLWLADHQHDVVIGVTGTKGKSTTASLIAHFLRHAGRGVGLGGNVGEALFDLEDRLPSRVDVWVLELSSYQTSDLETVPHIVVVLNLFPEHFDWHGSVEVYYRDKLRLLRGDQLAILNARDPRLVERTRDIAKPCWFNAPGSLGENDGHLYDGALRLPLPTPSPLHGSHNISNIAAALTACRAVGVEPHECLDGLAHFRPLPHRLEVVGTRDGVTWVDDSISTTPESALAALHAFRGRPITLLAGGYDRRQDYAAMATALCTDRLVTAVITLPQNGSRIAAELRAAQQRTGTSLVVIEANSLVHAVTTARQLTPPGGLVLLSPAAPSYGEFRNFEERGDRFKDLADIDGAE